jgi:hypothetical protein
MVIRLVIDFGELIKVVLKVGMGKIPRWQLEGGSRKRAS